jgi:ABC-type cobalamin/Fe3+-siderophores transport system ATPase subunit
MNNKYKISNKKKGITHLKSLEIKGLWDEIDIKWKLDSNVNILIGKNCMGKTTLLKLIISIINEDTTSYKFKSSDLVFNDEKYIEVQKISDFNDLNEKIVDVNRYKFYVGEFSPSKSKKLKKPYLTQENILSKQEAEENREFSKFTQYIKIESINTFDLSAEELNNKAITQYPEIVTGLDIILYELINEFKNYQLKLRNLEKEENRLLDFKILEISSKGDKDTVNIEIQDDLIELTALISNKYKKIKQIYQQQSEFIKIVNKLFSDTEKQLDFDENNSIIFRKKNKIIKPSQLSSGEKQLLIILLTVIQQEKKPTIILMDEPELSLHLSWQIELIDSIKKLNPNSQLIIATHSPSVFMNGWNDKITRIEDIISTSTSL